MKADQSIDRTLRPAAAPPPRRSQAATLDAVEDSARHPTEGSALWYGREIAAGRLHPAEVTQACLARAVDIPAKHAFITLTPERAHAEASLNTPPQHGPSAGPLAGVPIGWKNLIDLRGVRTTAGSATTRKSPPAHTDAEIVQRAGAAGMVTIGTTNLSEFAYSGLGINSHFGTPANPRAPGRVPGGSSSGSAVAVALGVLPCAVGTDTSGSIRVPASFCGLVGFRPTCRRVSTAGVAPLAPTLDTIGTITRTVLDAIALDAVLTGSEPPASHTQPHAPGDILIPDGVLVDHLDPAVANQFSVTLERLRHANWTIRRHPIAEIDEGAQLFEQLGTLVAAEAYRTHAATIDGADAELIDPRIRTRLLTGRSILKNSYHTLLARRIELRRRIQKRLGPTVLIYPTVAVPPPHLAHVESDPRAFAEANQQVLRNTMITSFLDLPSITLPAGMSPDGTPFGLSISAAPSADHLALRTAAAAEPTLSTTKPHSPDHTT